MNINRRNLIIATVLILQTMGCGSSGQVARVAIQAADRQAQQNDELVRLNREVATGTKTLVEADAQSRQDLIAAQQQLQAQQADVGRNRDQLEIERKTIARQRQTVSLWTPLLQGLGIVLLAVLPSGLCWCLLYGLRRDSDGSQELSELLVMELTADKPCLLPWNQPDLQALPSPDHPVPDGMTDADPPELFGPDL